MIEKVVADLIAYGLRFLDLSQQDIIYVRNKLYALLKIESPHPVPPIVERIVNYEEPSPMLDFIQAYALKNNLIDEAGVDRFLNDIMDVLLPRPSEVIHKMDKMSPEMKTQYLYNLSIKGYYIRKRAIDRNLTYTYPNLVVTINLAKPEIIHKPTKPKEVSHYPQCPLCPENIGFHGNDATSPRQTLRYYPMKLNNEIWMLQYSPYVYFPEHSIIFNEQHVPMILTKETFIRLVDFVDQFPHYFIGSNSGIPRVGGSILNHDHYQGGNYRFPLQNAPLKESFIHPNYPDVSIGIVHWHNSVIRLENHDHHSLIELADLIRLNWASYSNPELSIINQTDEFHNGITPIIHKEDESYILNIILRNNRTTNDYPDGIFHAHPQYHHIKKEGIGLIEAMGMFILPGRVSQEINNHTLTKEEIYESCINILKNTAVFKEDEIGQKAFRHFILTLIQNKNNNN